MSNQRSSVCGVGINDADYKTTIVKTKLIGGKRTTISKWECQYYSTWRNMLLRCYSEKYQNKNQSYIGVTVCDYWHVFSNFKKWMETQPHEGNHLDKDLLSGEVYSPDTCLFIPPKVNYFIRDSRKPTGLNGACFDKARNKWISACSTAFGKVKNLGRFDTEIEAHQAWKTEKAKQARLLAETIDDKRIACALIARYN